MKLASAGVHVQTTRMQVVAENLANADTRPDKPGVLPYRCELITFKNELDRTLGIDRVQVDRIKTDTTEFEHDAMDAPEVVAKGADRVAQRIREVAEENDVPLVENPPLARALFAGVEIGDPIPTEHYRAVAEVIGYVMQLRRYGRKAPTGASPGINL